MLDAGNRKIFTLASAGSHVVFHRIAVNWMNVAWIAGNVGGDITRALNEYFASISYAQGGGVVVIPNSQTPWTTTGGHLVPYGTTIKGISMDSDALAGPRINMMSSNTFMFKISDSVFNTQFQHINLHNNGQTNNAGVLFEGTTNATFNHYFKYCAFVGFKRGVSGVPTSGFGWMINQVVFDQCAFVTNTEAAIYWYSINGVVNIKNCSFQMSSGQWGLILQHAGVWNVEQNEIAGGGISDGAGWAWLRADYVALNFNGNEDENANYTILDEAICTNGTVNLNGNILQGDLMMNGNNTTYFTKGNFYPTSSGQWKDKNTPNTTPDAVVYSWDRATSAVFTHGCTFKPMVTRDSTDTFTNKRITPRTVGLIAAGVIGSWQDAFDLVTLSAQDQALTVGSPGGSPTEGQPLGLRFKDDGSARAITWNGIYRSIATLPTTTVAGTVMYIFFRYNAQDSKWDCLDVKTQP
jgi:hypothetical protein